MNKKRGNCLQRGKNIYSDRKTRNTKIKGKDNGESEARNQNNIILPRGGRDRCMGVCFGWDMRGQSKVRESGRENGREWEKWEGGGEEAGERWKEENAERMNAGRIVVIEEGQEGKR